MTRSVLNTAFFDTLEAFNPAADFVADFEDELAAFSSDLGPLNHDLVLLQLSSALIRFGGTGYEIGSDGAFDFIDYEIRISGSGIGPISSLAELEAAVDRGIATGSLNRIEILREGTEVLELSLRPGGYTLASGAQSIVLEGATPTTLNGIFRLGRLFDQLADVDTMTNRQREALFTKLETLKITDLSFHDGAATLLDLHIGPQQVNLVLGGLTFRLVGNFPDSMGKALSALWKLSDLLDEGTPFDPALVDGLDVTRFSVFDSTGAVLLTMTDFFSDQSDRWIVDGRSFAGVILGSNDVRLPAVGKKSTRPTRRN